MKFTWLDKISRVLVRKAIGGINMVEIDKLKEIVETLRSENSCPWNRAQIQESLKPECIEAAKSISKKLKSERGISNA